MRRLYDIANVLRSLKLIDKVHVTCEERGRKPAFEWVGPEDFPPIRGDFVLNLQSKHIATIMNFYLTRLKETLRSRPLLFYFFLIPHHPPHHHFPADLQNDTAGSPAGGSRGALEPRPLPLGNCAKNLFPSPGGATKRSFTRHPSLIKMAKSIQDDRRKISSAPSSPVKGALGE